MQGDTCTTVPRPARPVSSASRAMESRAPSMLEGFKNCSPHVCFSNSPVLDAPGPGLSESGLQSFVTQKTQEVRTAWAIYGPMAGRLLRETGASRNPKSLRGTCSQPFTRAPARVAMWCQSRGKFTRPLAQNSGHFASFFLRAPAQKIAAFCLQSCSILGSAGTPPLGRTRRSHA